MVTMIMMIMMIMMMMTMMVMLTVTVTRMVMAMMGRRTAMRMTMTMMLTMTMTMMMLMVVVMLKVRNLHLGGGGPLPPIRFPPGPQPKSACHWRLVILDICIFFAALQLSTCSSPSTLYTRHHMPHSFSMSVASLRDYTSTHKVPQPSIHRLKHFSPISCMYLVSKLSTSILH